MGDEFNLSGLDGLGFTDDDVQAIAGMPDDQWVPDLGNLTPEQQDALLGAVNTVRADPARYRPQPAAVQQRAVNKLRHPGAKVQARDIRKLSPNDRLGSVLCLAVVKDQGDGTKKVIHPAFNFLPISGYSENCISDNTTGGGEPMLAFSETDRTLLKNDLNYEDAARKTVLTDTISWVGYSVRWYYQGLAVTPRMLEDLGRVKLQVRTQANQKGAGKPFQLRTLGNLYQPEVFTTASDQFFMRQRTDVTRLSERIVAPAKVPFVLSFDEWSAAWVAELNGDFAANSGKYFALELYLHGLLTGPQGI